MPPLFPILSEKRFRFIPNMLPSSLSLVFPVLLMCMLKPRTEETNDVFISFSGDTRSRFTSHLKASFSRHEIESFSDNQIERGADTFPTLLQEIKRSKISVIVFSEGYAASHWCLDELVKIMKRKRKRQQTVVPIFYGVKPTEVRDQSGIYEAAFAKHEQSYRRRRVQRWRSAMTEAANVSGWDISTYGRESQLVDDIATDIKHKIESIRQRRRRRSSHQIATLYQRGFLPSSSCHGL